MRRLLLASLLFSPLASAKIYECYDDKGIVMYSEMSCHEQNMKDKNSYSVPANANNKKERGLSYEEIKTLVNNTKTEGE